MSDEKKRIHRNSKDIGQRSHFLQYEKGEIPFETLGLNNKRIKEQLPSEVFAQFETIDDEVDRLYMMEDDTLLHLEFQSSYNNGDVSDIDRFYTYDYLLTRMHEKKVQTIAVYTCKVPENIPSEIDLGSIKYSITNVILSEYDSDKYFIPIKHKIETNPKVELSKEEEVMLVYSAFMGSTQGINKRTEEIFEIVKTLELDIEARKNVLGSLLLMTFGLVSEKVTTKILEEGLNMGLLSKERENEILKEIVFRKKLKEEKIKAAKEFLKNGVTIEVVCESLEITPEDLEENKA